ncbi:MAG: ATP phosphoribosyltransferase regulatory subunit [Gammaproteobacteria bacterium]|nr:ATP phosphoribosyltransferase regulatory subunit [Gammaproteobacteria bacterium]
MDKRSHWLLPEGIEEVLPPDAERLDALCRGVLDQFRAWGYELVVPPLMEYLETLLAGTGEDVALQSFKVTDQLSGRMLGIRADMTPQMARIDAHVLKRETPTRLCYLGTVLHTRPRNQGGTRAPLQVGAELYGHSGPESDAEILVLMLKTLQLAGLRELHVDLGHAGIFRAMTRGMKLTPAREQDLFDSLQRKSAAELHSSVRDWGLPAKLGEPLMQLVELYGDAAVLGQARRALAGAGDEVRQCIDNLARIAELVRRQVKDAPLYFDLAELDGYHYHTGMMFSTYVAGEGQGIAFGGRYDDIGAAFGRRRPATGFSIDVNLLFGRAARASPPRSAIYAPVSEVPGLVEMIEQQRRQGEIVICELPGHEGDIRAMGCDRELALEKGRWIVRRLAGK